MNNQQKQVKDICYRCIVHVGDSNITVSHFSEENRDKIHTMGNLKDSGEEIPNQNPQLKAFHKYLDGLPESKYKVLSNQGIGYCFVLQNYSAEYKEALRVALDNAGFYTLADTKQVLIISDVEAAVFSVAREETQEITVVSLKCDQVITASASKQSVKIRHTRDLGTNLLSNLKSKFASFFQDQKPESVLTLDQQWKIFKEVSQSISEDKLLDSTAFDPYSRSVDLKPLKFTPQENKKLLQPIEDAFEIIEKIKHKEKKLIVLDDLGYFGNHIQRKISSMSPCTSEDVERAPKKLMETKKTLHDTTQVVNVLSGKLWTAKNCGGLAEAQDTYDKAVQKRDNAQESYHKAVKDEKETWLTHVAAVKIDSLIKGASVACKPFVSETPVYKDGKKTGRKNILSVNDAYTTIIAIDFGTDTSKFIVYKKTDDKWIEVSRDSILSVAYYDEKDKEQCFVGDEAWEKYRESSKVYGSQVFRGFKLMLEKINDYADIDFITVKIANFLRTIYKKAKIEPTDENVHFSFSYPSVWSQRASLVMRQAVTLSGVQVNANNINRVLMIPEAEAVAISCAETIKAKAEEALLVRDEDIYYFAAIWITPNDGIISGSHSLDDAFIKLAEIKCFEHEVCPSPTDLACIGYEFARTTKIDYDGSTKVEFKQDFVIQGKTVKVHITNQELRDKVFNPIFSKIIETIDRILKEAITQPDLIYFSGGLSLAKALRKEAKSSSFASKVIFKEKDGDWDVVTGSAKFAMNTEIITERAFARPYFLETYSLFDKFRDMTINRKIVDNVEYSKSRALCLCDSTSVENNGFSEYQLSLLTKGNDAITLILYDGDKVAKHSKCTVKTVSDKTITRTHTYYIALADLVISENESFKIRIYPSYSIIELVFEDAIYRLVGFEAVKVGTPKEEQIHYFSEEEEKKNSEGKARQREAYQNRIVAEAPSFFKKLIKACKNDH
ncbi:hypothetical protein [Parasitella parasitica]|uniref:Uncharacterized protein n=1 Tax=Parasitella parasitica TaxID=35722 RepID=A0A0B7NEE8_9FUNG|nr:hypothetical protein [Parasitella parasitica]